MSTIPDASAVWAASKDDTVQVRLHTTRIKPGHYRAFAAVYVRDAQGQWTCPKGTSQVGTINKDTNLVSSQEWVTNRWDLPGVPASSGFHPTLGMARSRMADAVLSSALKTMEA